MKYFFNTYVDKKDLSTLINSVTPYEDMGFTVSIDLYLIQVETVVDMWGLVEKRNRYVYVTSYPNIDSDIYFDGDEMKSYIENGLVYYLRIENPDDVKINLDKYKTFSQDLLPKLKSKFKEISWMRNVKNELYLTTIEHNFKLK